MSRGWAGRAPRRSGAGRRRRGARALVFDTLLAAAILLLLALVAGRLQQVPTVAISGAVRVVDGDSLEAAGERIRLYGIDAPELSQTCRKAGADYACGQEAREALKRLAGGRAVECEGHGRDRYGRLLAVCRAGGIDLNGRQVLDGRAVAYGGYADEEAQARAAGRGIWAGTFETPGAWRAAHGAGTEAPHKAPGGTSGWPADLLDWILGRTRR